MLVSSNEVIQQNISTPIFLGESWGFWCQLLVLVVTAIVAISTLIKNEKRARRRATIDIVLSENQDENFRDIKEQYALMRKAGVNFTALAFENPKDTEDEKIEKLGQKEILIAFLNQYEFIASAIFEYSLDEKLYRRMKESVVVRDWDVLEGFVLELRKQENRMKIFCETEKLAKKWKNIS